MRSNLPTYKSVIMFFLIFITISTSPAFAENTTFRLKPSSPAQLLTQIYNNVLSGNNRLIDIEAYMSPGLKSAYKKAIKTMAKGKSCNIPKILSNEINTNKLVGFTVNQDEKSFWSSQMTVILNTGSSSQKQDDALSKFDPKIYEKVKFKFIRRFVDWKIDNIITLKPKYNETSNLVTYEPLNLRDLLKSCK
jgi:hypothetical protein